jgi:riboflavin kinase/FMN adenylyltransferase
MAVHDIPWQASFPEICRGGALTIGNFDGVHLGHAELLGKLREEARRVRGPAVALTFDPHPVCILHPERCPPALTTPSDRAEWMQQCGADQVLMLRVDRDMLQLTAQEFFDHIVRGKANPRAMVEGGNFGFGHNREGNIDTLMRLCLGAGIEFASVQPVLFDGQPVSSSRVRDAVACGEIADAAQLLGRPYRLHGVVGAGQKRGQTLGFPTANLERIPNLIPGDGVYGVKALVEGKTWPGAANIGPNPTFGENSRKVEVHLIGFHGDLYGRAIAVDFLDRLRATKRFASSGELAAQLKIDVEQARRIADAAKVT